MHSTSPRRGSGEVDMLVTRGEGEDEDEDEHEAIFRMDGFDSPRRRLPLERHGEAERQRRRHTNEKAQKICAPQSVGTLIVPSRMKK